MKFLPRPLATAVAISASVAMLAACAPSSSSSSDSESTELSLVGFAVPKAGNNAAQAAFAKTDAGKGTTWKESYGASGDQSRAVAGGLKADYVHFSITPDVTRLVDEGLVAKDWNAGPNKGIVTDSVVVLVVREGNPKNIKGWDDLAKKDVGIVTPNPGSSGAARWNILAAWQHVIAGGGSEPEADFAVQHGGLHAPLLVERQGIVERAFHRGRQPAQVMLEDVVGRAALQRLDGVLLADRP